MASQQKTPLAKSTFSLFIVALAMSMFRVIWNMISVGLAAGAPNAIVSSQFAQDFLLFYAPMILAIVFLAMNKKNPALLAIPCAVLVLRIINFFGAFNFGGSGIFIFFAFQNVLAASFHLAGAICYLVAVIFALFNKGKKGSVEKLVKVFFPFSIVAVVIGAANTFILDIYRIAERMMSIPAFVISFFAMGIGVAVGAIFAVACRNLVGWLSEGRKSEEAPRADEANPFAPVVEEAPKTDDANPFAPVVEEAPAAAPAEAAPATEAPAAVNYRFCPQCGGELPEGSLFCSHCGNRLK